MQNAEWRMGNVKWVDHRVGCRWRADGAGGVAKLQKGYTLRVRRFPQGMRLRLLWRLYRI
jgi:tryptophan 2,3-dioxygenase